MPALESIFQSLGLNPSEDELQDLFHELDKEDTGVIQLQEINELLENQINDINEEQELIDVFNIFDKESKGSLNMKQISEILYALGEKFSDEEILIIIGQADSGN